MYVVDLEIANKYLSIINGCYNILNIIIQSHTWLCSMLTVAYLPINVNVQANAKT